MQKESKILVWGAGNTARDVVKNGINGEIIGFIENKKTADIFLQKRIYSIDEIPEDYDYIVVASSYVNSIYKTCLEKGMDFKRIIFLKGIKKYVGGVEPQTVKTIIGEMNYINYCIEFGIHENTFYEDAVREYTRLNTRDNFRIQEENAIPIIKDKYAPAGTIDNYFWQDLWAARLIYKSGIKKHFDIGSRIDGFIAHLLAMDIEVSLIDIRKFPGEVEHLHTILDDATRLTQIEDRSIESMSALCSLEHFGLGRYGDPIDPESCFNCFAEIQKKIKPGGNSSFSISHFCIIRKVPY